LSLHDIDLLDSLGMAELLGNKPELSVVGIEPETINWGMELTHTLKENYPVFLEHARKQIRSILS